MKKIKIYIITFLFLVFCWFYSHNSYAYKTWHHPVGVYLSSQNVYTNVEEMCKASLVGMYKYNNYNPIFLNYSYFSYNLSLNGQGLFCNFDTDPSDGVNSSDQGYGGYYMLDNFVEENCPPLTSNAPNGLGVCVSPPDSGNCSDLANSYPSNSFQTNLLFPNAPNFLSSEKEFGSGVYCEMMLTEIGSVNYEGEENCRVHTYRFTGLDGNVFNRLIDIPSEYFCQGNNIDPNPVEPNPDAPVCDDETEDYDDISNTCVPKPNNGCPEGSYWLADLPGCVLYSSSEEVENPVNSPDDTVSTKKIESEKIVKNADGTETVIKEIVYEYTDSEGNKTYSTPQKTETTRPQIPGLSDIADNTSSSKESLDGIFGFLEGFFDGSEGFANDHSINPSDAFSENSEEVDFSNVINPNNSFFNNGRSGQCPPPVSIDMSDLQILDTQFDDIEIDLTYLCMGIGWLKSIIIFLGVYRGYRIIVGGAK